MKIITTIRLNSGLILCLFVFLLQKVSAQELHRELQENVQYKLLLKEVTLRKYMCTRLMPDKITLQPQVGQDIPVNFSREVTVNKWRLRAPPYY